jgi:hypothetical protein
VLNLSRPFTAALIGGAVLALVGVAWQVVLALVGVGLVGLAASPIVEARAQARTYYEGVQQHTVGRGLPCSGQARWRESWLWRATWPGPSRR